MTIASELRESAVIEVSSNDPGIPNRKLTGTIQARLKKSLTVMTDQEIVSTTTVRIQSKDVLTLGEVLHCTQEPDEMWTVHVSIQRNMFIV